MTSGQRRFSRSFLRDFRAAVDVLNDGRPEPARQMLLELVEREPGYLWAWQVLVQASVRSNRYASVLAGLQERTKERPDEPAAHYGLGYLGRLAGWPVRQARGPLLRAVRLAEPCFPAQVELAGLDMQEGRPERAELRLRELLEEFGRQRDDWGRATAMLHLAHAVRERFDYQGAEELYPRAVTLKRRVGDRFGEALALTSMGVLDTELGRHRQAIRRYREALAIQDAIGGGVGRVHVLVCLAVGHVRRERMDDAESALREALKTARGLRHPQGMVTVQVNLAEVALRKSQHARAVRLLEEAIALAESHRLDRDASVAYRALARSLRERGRLASAEASLRQAKRLARRHDERLHKASLASEEAELALMLGEYRRALRCARLALRLNDQHRELGGGTCATDLLALLRLGLAEEALGRRQRALGAYRELLDGLEQELPRSRREDLQLDLLALYQRPVLRAASLILEEARDEAAVESLLLVDRGRARALRYHAGGAVAEGRLPSSLRERRDRLRATLRGIESALDRQFLTGAAATKERLNALRRQRESCRLELEDVARQVEERQPARRLETPSDLREVQRALGVDSALLYFLVGEEQVLAWVVTEHSVRAERIALTPRGLERLVRSLLAEVRSPETAFSLDLGLAGFSGELGCRLYRRLIAPFERELEGRRRLVVVPDGILCYLPFECLSPPRDDTAISHWCELEYLVERHAVVTCPSLAHVLTPPRRRRGRASLVAFACSHGQVEGREEPLGELEHVDEEVIGLTRHFEQAELLVGDEATEAAYRRRARTATHLHLAGHAEVDVTSPAYSGLVLSTGEPGAPARLLHAQDVREVSLRCELVTLSACSTGLGPLRRGEGVLSLARSFLTAGADAVVMSLWRVQDRSTARFVEELYQGLGAGRTRVDAVREAKLALLRAGRDGGDGRLAHPWFWAPFVLVDTRLAQ
ncbi:MAG: CHAT domain-containing protein [Acidobacteriota bacterium]